MAWLGQIRFPVPKCLTGTINCSCFCEWSWSLVCCNLSRVLNVSLQLIIEMIAMTVQKWEVKDLGIWWLWRQSNNARMMKIWTSSFPWVGQAVARRLEAWIYKWTMIRPYITEPWPTVSAASVRQLPYFCSHFQLRTNQKKPNLFLKSIT